MPRPRAMLTYSSKVIPRWAIRLVIAALILPVLLTAVDGFARVRRRREPVGRWLIWTAANTLPFLAAAAFAFLLELTGLLPVMPKAPMPAGALPLDGAAWAAMASIALVVVLAWFTLRPLALALGGMHGRTLPDPAAPGAAAAVLLASSALVTAIWIGNPYAAALVVLALHVTLLLVAPAVRIRPALAVVLLLIGLAPVLLVALYYARALALSPGELPWLGVQLLVGGHLGVLGDLAWCLSAGLLASVVVVVRAQARGPAEPAGPRTRGPVSYAGPGSLGGTESALRR